jgi:hypothetical protein
VHQVPLHDNGVAAADGAPDFFFFSIYFNLCELCIRCRSTTFSCDAIRGTRLFFFNLFVLVYLNFASAAAPQPEVAVPDGTPDFFCVVNYLFQIISMVHQVPLHNKKSGRQTGR